MGTAKLKLRTLLLSVFLFIFVGSSVAMMAFTFSKYSHSIHDLSNDTINRAGKSLIARINCFIEDFETLPVIGMNMVVRHPEVNADNQDLIYFLLSEVQNISILHAYYVGFANGNYLIAADLSIAYIPAVAAAPPNASYAVIYANDPSTEYWVYYNSKLEPLSTQKIPRDFNPNTRPWYEGAEQTKQLYWTDVYVYNHTKNALGISVSQPIYDSNKQLTAVVGADLSLNEFSEFIDQQPISKNGLAFVLDSNGHVLLPKSQKTANAKALASAAVEAFSKEKTSNFSFNFSGETYLGAMNPMKISLHKDWLIAIIAPRSDFFSEILHAQHLVILFSLGVILLTAILVIFLAYHISKPITQLSKEIDKIAQLDLDSEKRVSSPIYEISEFDQAIASMRTALRSFSHYVPSEIAKQLMHSKHEISLQGEKKRISVMFTDIANFTSIAEGMPIETVNNLLAAHFDALSKIILDCGGLIDKYIGDSVMSLWGASQETPDHAVRACRAALLCQVKLSELNEQQKKAGMPAFSTRIGINAGLAIVGNFGTALRMNYSAIGDAVNAASRLQTINKNYGTKIIIGEEVAKDIGDRFLIRPLERVEVRGKKQKIKIFELGAQYGDLQSIAPTQDLVKLFSMFTKAYDLLEEGNIEEAKKQFLAIEKIFPDDPPTKLYLDRLKT